MNNGANQCFSSLSLPLHTNVFKETLQRIFIRASVTKCVCYPPPPHSRQCVGLFFVQSKDETGVDHIELLVC